ncbi:MAG: hypothetical protein WCD18_03760 [Thermosynechococcaceae cyanobacterium]
MALETLTIQELWALVEQNTDPKGILQGEQGKAAAAELRRRMYPVTIVDAFTNQELTPPRS